MASHDPYCRKPEPTHLVLFEQVHMQETGTKIRVLGCVQEYMIDTATIVLKGEYTASTSPDLTVFAGISNVLESVNSELLQVGAWVNIVGYAKPRTLISAPTKKHKKGSKPLSIPSIEVLLIWSAGAVKLTEYQSAVRSFQSTSRPLG